MVVPKINLIYLDTSIFAGKLLLKDNEDKKCSLLLRRVINNKYENFQFITSKITLIELAELIARKKTKNKAKLFLFDLMYNPDLKVSLVDLETSHLSYEGKEYYEINDLIANIVNTALDYQIPGFDTIHAHTVKNLNEDVVAVSKDRDFKRFENLKNVLEVLKASDFITKYK